MKRKSAILALGGLFLLAVAGISTLLLTGSGGSGGAWITTETTEETFGVGGQAFVESITVGQTTRADLDALTDVPTDVIEVGELEVRIYSITTVVRSRDLLFGAMPLGMMTSSTLEESIVVLRGDEVVRTSDTPSDDPAVEAAYMSALSTQVEALLGDIDETGEAGESDAAGSGSAGEASAESRR